MSKAPHHPVWDDNMVGNAKLSTDSQTLYARFSSLKLKPDEDEAAIGFPVFISSVSFISQFFCEVGLATAC